MRFVREWAERRTPELARQVQASLTPIRVPWRYQNLWLVALDATPLFSAKASVRPEFEAGLLARCNGSREPVVSLLHEAHSLEPFIDMCSPVIEPGGQALPVALYVQRVDARQFLLPTVQFWTRPRASAATVVVRPGPSGLQIVASSQPGDRVGDAPTRLPREWIADRRTATHGVDSRGVHVLGAIRDVPNTDWQVILTIDRAEVVEPHLDSLAVLLLLALLLATTGWLGVVLWFNRKERANARQVMRMDRLIQVRSAINEAVVRIRERENMLARFCEIAVSLGRFDFAVIFELPGQRIVRLRAWHGALPERFGSTTEFPLEEGLRHGPLGPLFESGQVAIIPDLLAERPDPWIASLVEAGHRAVVFIPIREGARVTGLFGLYSKEPGVFDHRDAQLFSELAGDISFALESVEADKDRRVVEAQLHAVSDAAPFAMFLIDQKDHRIDRVNPAAARQYGYTEDELVGLPATIIFSRDQLAPTPPLGDSLAPLPVTASHRTKDGRALKVEVTTRPIQIDGAAYDVVVAIDVTERRQLEEQYRQAQRLEAVGKLAGGIAHDFNNLLTVIGGFSAFVLEDLPADSPARAGAQQIQIAASRAAELTGQLLAFSRRQTMVTKHLRLNDVVRETATMLARVIGEDVVLDLKLEAARDAVNVDPSQMQQVIMNLAVNARDAMKKGGRLTIATAELADFVELRITDTGDGIPPEVLEHIFEPFFTTKPPGQGTGLGLPTVHGIVAQSNGEISVQTRVGSGTSFIIRLPRIEGDEPAPQARPSAQAQAGQGTILLVEDDPGVRALTRLVLLRGGYTVIECANGAAALDRATASTQLPITLLVTDVVMPGMSGPELAERLRTYYPGLPVLFMSGYAEDAAARLGLDLATLDLLRKPFAPNDLLQRVTAAITRTQQT